MQKLNHQTILENKAQLGQKVLSFSAPAVDKDGNFFDWNIEDNLQAKKWTVIAFYPADFTFVCPTEIRKISDLADQFAEANANIVVASVDSPFVHLNWRDTSLGKIKIPMISDQNHLISEYFGIYAPEKGLAWRGTFIISPDAKLYVTYNTFGEVGRSAQEIIRLLKAAQAADSGKMVPCEWNPGDDTL